MRTGSLIIAFGVLALSATSIEAQTCFGNAPFSAGPVRIDAGLSTSEGTKSYGVDLAVGAKSGPFASGGVSRTRYSDLDGSGRDGSSTSFGISAGYAIDLNAGKTMQFCPYADFDHTSGPDIDFGQYMIATSADAVGYGGSFGGAVRVGPTLDLVPFAGATYLVVRERDALNGLDTDTHHESYRYGLIGVGAGFVIDKVLTLQPQVSIPVGVEGAKSSFQLAVSYNFGSAKH